MEEVRVNSWPVSLDVEVPKPNISAALLLPLISLSLTMDNDAPDREPPPNICNRLLESKNAVTRSASGPETTTSLSTIFRV